MTEIVISLERGSDNQPVGTLRSDPGGTRPFTGWLDLIRALEDELLTAEDLAQAPTPKATELRLPRFDRQG